MYSWVYLDPANMPSEVMLQWYENGSFEHRAYWGANNVALGTDGTASRKRIGDLPPAGQWVKLVIPASAVDLEGKSVSGMAFGVYGGRGTWDQTGKESATVDDLLTILRNTGVKVLIPTFFVDSLDR